MAMDSVLHVERIGKTDRFRGSKYIKTKDNRGFGGHTVAQSLVSALKTIDDSRYLIQSVHCYFLNPANIEADVLYHVERLKDGRTISTRAVNAIQSERVIFSCLVSFSIEDKSKDELFHNQYPVPQIDLNVNNNEGEVFIDNDTYEYPLKMIEVPNDNQDRITCWLKSKNNLPLMVDSNQNYHRIALAYASDLGMVLLVFMKYPSYFQKSLFTSLDHTIWFHDDVNFNEWNLFSRECVLSTHSKPLNSARVYNQSGTQVATVMQQSLVLVKAKI